MNYQELDNIQLLKQYTKLANAVSKNNKLPPGEIVTRHFTDCAEELIQRLNRVPTIGTKEVLINALIKECGTRHNKPAKIRNIINKFL